MYMTKTREYVGEVINGFRLIKELPNLREDDPCSQIIHNHRRFLAEHEETGSKIVRTLLQLRNHKMLIPSDWSHFEDLAGQTIGSYKVLHLDPKYNVIGGRVVWVCRHLPTGVHVRFTTTDISYERERKKQGSLRRSKSTEPELFLIYNQWFILKKVFNNNGYKICEEWRTNYRSFEKEVLNTLGKAPSDNHVIAPIHGRTVTPDNFQWINPNSKTSTFKPLEDAR
tara:strand:+ start:1392 stop:2069 length:678 start_codon:yes stop_codon:yes gene_type:complete